MLVFLATIEDESERTKIEQIYELYSEYMFRLSFAILHNREDSEDAVQTAMVKACKHVKKLQEPHSNLSKWYVLETTRNAAIDIYRKKLSIREKEASLHEICKWEKAVSNYDGENVALRQFMDLSPADRDVLMLKYKYGFNYSEIADSMGMSKDAVRKMAQRARERLEKNLKEDQSK